MFICRNKDEETISMLYYILNRALKQAKEKQQHYFYYGLLSKEEARAKIWAISHNILMEYYNTNGNTKIYKFFLI